MENHQIEEPMYHAKDYDEQDWRDEAEARERDSARRDMRDMQEVHFHAETPEETARFEALDAQPTAALDEIPASTPRGMARIGNGLFVRTRRVA